MKLWDVFCCFTSKSYHVSPLGEISREADRRVKEDKQGASNKVLDNFIDRIRRYDEGNIDEYIILHAFAHLLDRQIIIIDKDDFCFDRKINHLISEKFFSHK